MSKIVTILACIMVAGVVVGASLPIFDSITASSDSVKNEGAGWVRFALDKNVGTTYTLSYTEDENGFYIDNGTDRQTYDDSSTLGFDTILYADSNLSVWVDGEIHILGTNEGNPFYLDGFGPLTIVRDAEGVTVTPDGLDPVTFGVPTWSYIPVSTGNYGFFLAADLDDELGTGVKNYPSDMPLAVVGGGFAGVYAYNDIYRYNGLGLSMKTVYDDDGLFYGAYWDKTAAAVEPLTITPIDFDPSAIDLDPIDIDLDPLNPGAQIMSVPTPTYTDGDWGYDLVGSDANIVSYSGTGGGVIEIPSTVGGYTVTQLGKGSSSNYNIFNPSITCTQLIIPSTVTQINQNAFRTCSGLGGELVIPSTVTRINEYAFRGCSGFTGLSITEDTKLWGAGVFWGCSGMTGTAVMPAVSTGYESIVQNTYTNCTGFTSLKIPDYVWELGADTYSGCTGMVGTLVIPSTITDMGAYRQFNNTHFDSLVYVSEALPSGSGSNSSFGTMSYITQILDLSDTVDFSQNRYGLPAGAEVSESIGDCFGFVSVVEYQTPGGGSPTQELIGMIPLIMVLGLVLVAVGMFIWNRM